ncbi:hypothetical protein N825_03585 [Skermanella stibiiresistens SB22]|uniref:Uncharacterized protein n=1 Tax=Skermanella stibiiresistens SB22 TaxID=1385369 RepID=W9H8E3_9PROT|nr:hypothetical protein [Skermanella stibiiresistens]EWY40068.1 hypothetical protein N825_03585 [Skermanella stibiiresistens SB22]
MFDSDTNRSDTNRRRDPEPTDPNNRALVRFAMLTGLSLLLASLWPPQLFPVMLAGFLFINAMTSALVAALRRQPFLADHLTRWDEGAAFYVTGFIASLFIDPAVVEETLKTTTIMG